MVRRVLFKPILKAYYCSRQLKKDAFLNINLSNVGLPLSCNKRHHRIKPHHRTIDRRLIMSESPETATMQDSPALILPQRFPLSSVSKAELRRIQPESKTTYNDKYVQSFITDITNTLIETISTRLNIAAQKYRQEIITAEEYAASRDNIYASVSQGDWLQGLRHAFNKYSLSADAYLLLTNTTLQRAEHDVNINNLYEYALKQQHEPTPPLIDTFNSHYDSLETLHASANEEAETVVTRQLRQILFVATYPDQPIPSQLENDASNDDDLEVEMEGGRVDLTCPITREMFKKPYKNTKCGHTYDMDALKLYLRSSNECPECGSSVSLNTMIPDIIMQTRVKGVQRDKMLAELVKDRLEDDTDKL